MMKSMTTGAFTRRGLEMESKEVARLSPNEMISQAVSKGANLEQLQGLLDLQIKYEQNEAKKAYTVAMAAFKANPPQIIKDRKVAYKEVRYAHASLANVADKINESLSKQGLSASWTTAQNGSVSVTCKITHVLGHSEETTLSAPSDTTGSKNAIQAIGSTISYLQRYTLLSLTGLATHDQDDDGVGTSADYITEDNVLDLEALLSETKSNKKKYLAYMKVEQLSDILTKDYKRAVEVLVAKQRKLSEKVETVDVEKEGKC